MKTEYLIHVMIMLVTLFISCSSEPGVDEPDDVEKEQPVLTVSPAQSISVEATGGSSVISVSTNQGSWSAGSSQSWCKISDKTAGQFTIAVDPNATATVRDATVTVNAGKATPVKIALSQQGAAPTLSLSPAAGTIVFAASPQEQQFTYQVTTNLTSWEVVVTPAEATWCKVTKDAGNSRFTITAETNRSTSSRGPATVTVTAGSATPQQITVNQRANTSQESEDYEYGDEEIWD